MNCGASEIALAFTLTSISKPPSEGSRPKIGCGTSVGKWTSSATMKSRIVHQVPVGSTLTVVGTVCWE